MIKSKTIQIFICDKCGEEIPNDLCITLKEKQLCRKCVKKFHLLIDEEFETFVTSKPTLMDKFLNSSD